MKSKFLIFVLFATTTQSSFGLGLTNSCGGTTADIGAELAIIQFAEDTAHTGLERVNDLIYDLIFATLAKKSAFGTKIETEVASSTHDENVQEEIVTAYMVGIDPAMEAVRTIQPNVDVAASHDLIYPVMVKITRSIYHAISLTKCKNYHKNLPLIEIDHKEAELQSITLISNFFIDLRTGNNFSAEIEALLNCVEEEITGQILGAYDAIFHAIKILLVHLSTGTSAETEICLSAIEAARKESSYLFNIEVTTKYNAFRHLLIGKFLNETGIVPGLFALQSIHAKPYVELKENAKYSQWK